MSRSLRVRQSRIDTVKLAVRRSGFPSQRALSEDIGLSLATVSNFLTGRPVDRATFLELCEKLSLDSGEISDLGPDLILALALILGLAPTLTLVRASPRL
jgi:DNA-binding Xre family transcriptional regulator